MQSHRCIRCSNTTTNADTAPPQLMRTPLLRTLNCVTQICISWSWAAVHKWTLRALYCTLHYTCYTVQYTCYTVQYTCYTVQYTCYTVQYTCYTLQYTCYTIQYTCYTIQYTCYTIQYTCYTIQYSSSPATESLMLKAWPQPRPGAGWLSGCFIYYSTTFT